eukprot:GGOE01017842.1.p1 GENE.GGOE01017842.1~~GGOE01017842.1.p1  ORF type:complete len:557 (+),score=100.64 GGOE01017842.1:71-1741(+)
MSNLGEARQRHANYCQSADTEDGTTSPRVISTPKRQKKVLLPLVVLLFAVGFVVVVYFLAISSTPIGDETNEETGGRPRRVNMKALRERSFRHSAYNPTDAGRMDDIAVKKVETTKRTSHNTSETVPHGRRKPKPTGRAAAKVVSRTEHAFVSVSLLAKSLLLKQKKCELVLLGPKDLAPDSAVRLRAAGYVQIKSVSDSLSDIIPNSAWKGTFDKLYLWSFTEYKLVAFFDADMLALTDPDAVFDFRPPNASWIGAHGSRSGSYFQTGMMVIMPDETVFQSLLDFFKRGVQSHTFEGANARDGQVARAFFGSRYIRIPPSFSMYRNASESIEGVKGYHFRGKFKPWFDMNNPPRFKPSHANGAVEFGTAYRWWWEYYESFHVNFTKAGGENGHRYGGRLAGSSIHPATHVWMLRHTAEEYVQPLWQVVLRERNVVFETMTALVGHRAESCSTVCKKKSLECNAEGHTFTPINSCAFISRAVRKDCTKCEMDASDQLTPWFDPKSGRCNVNYLHDKLLMPTCDSQAPTVKRVCVCVPPSTRPRRVPFHTYEQIPLR